MFAKPDLLNKLIEVPNLIPNHLVFHNCGYDNEEGYYTIRYDADSEEYAGWSMFAPKDLAPDSSVIIKLLWWPWIDNATGSEKAVLWLLRTNHAFYPAVLGAGLVYNLVTGVIPDEEPRLTLHLETLGLIEHIQPNEYISAEVRRKAANGGDTWASEAVAIAVIIAEYTSTLLKKT